MHIAKAINLKRLFILTLVFGLSTERVRAEVNFAPLPDLTVENITHQTMRCSGFFAAFHTVLLSELTDFTGSVTDKDRLLELSSRSEENSDGMLKSSVILLTVLDQRSDEDAVNIALSEQSVSSAMYIAHLGQDSLSLADIADDDVWLNDGASCAALAASINDIIEQL